MTPSLDDAERAALVHLVELSLEEDHARDDVTSRLSIPPEDRARFVLRNRARGVPAALEAVGITLRTLGSDAQVHRMVDDGTVCEPGRDLVSIEGRRRDVLAAERTFLNCVGVLSGTATITRRFVEAAGAHCRILDTRKTWPGYRLLQKYAVRCGGGLNHRPHLAGGILLKDNHRHARLDLAELCKRARAEHPSLPLVVEVDTLEQLDLALGLPLDRILLDNFDVAMVEEAVRRRDARRVRIGLEVSGGVNLATIAAFAAAGADFASVGALTHSAGVWDVGLDESNGEPR